MHLSGLLVTFLTQTIGLSSIVLSFVLRLHTNPGYVIRYDFPPRSQKLSCYIATAITYVVTLALSLAWAYWIHSLECKRSTILHKVASAALARKSFVG